MDQQSFLLDTLGLGEYRRNVALTLANRKRAVSDTPEEVVERARVYEEYMLGSKVSTILSIPMEPLGDGLWRET